MADAIVFCYGSNMSSLRIKKRCSSAVFISTAKLVAHQFAFNKISRDGSSKANLIPTGNSNDIVRGVLFGLSHNDKSLLDGYEGLGKGYDEQTITVILPDRTTATVQTYISTNSKYLSENLLPYDWYKTHCIKGAIEFNLPTDYVSGIEEFRTIPDANLERREQELSLYK